MHLVDVEIRTMLDIVLVAASAAFFFLSIAYVRFCDQVK
jgi:hypothetical protein